MSIVASALRGLYSELLNTVGSAGRAPLQSELRSVLRLADASG